jgi:hypothetical protein
VSQLVTVTLIRPWNRFATLSVIQVSQTEYEWLAKYGYIRGTLLPDDTPPEPPPVDPPLARIEFLSRGRRRIINLFSNSCGKLLTVTLPDGQTIDGTLSAFAFDSEDQILFDPVEVGGSGPAVIEVELLPEDFDSYGNRDWDFQVSILDDGSGSDEVTEELIVATALIRYRQVRPRAIENITVTNIDCSSGS